MELSELPAYIKENLLEDLSVNRLARKCFISPSGFKTKFKAQFGETIGAYVIRMKMYAAADMLTSGTFETIEDVGCKIGYINMSHFSKRFHHFFGYLPKDCFIHKQRFRPAKQSDIHSCDQVLAKLVTTCPDKLKDDFVKHFGKPISAFLFERKSTGYSIKY